MINGISFTPTINFMEPWHYQSAIQSKLGYYRSLCKDDEDFNNRMESFYSYGITQYYFDGNPVFYISYSSDTAGDHFYIMNGSGLFGNYSARNSRYV